MYENIYFLHLKLNAKVFNPMIKNINLIRYKESKMNERGQSNQQLKEKEKGKNGTNSKINRGL